MHMGQQCGSLLWMMGTKAPPVAPRRVALVLRRSLQGYGQLSSLMMTLHLLRSQNQELRATLLVNYHRSSSVPMTQSDRCQRLLILRRQVVKFEVRPSLLIAV